ncbi:geranylgeranyl reductase family protein [Peteryoungia desertarenae]|uniref:Geranylgeranyl reductase family protein n=1 Tax=Peteryoungia desertarenae TaxID=1813451 RepID=A0ABX6QIR3_9HYPH|nr:geranylgeranyl reductase family protein [Peteryoungia desertarenae]QLF68182.1 geranylgeranyl reductase family protein [Peteryoungia desertarenae]
MGMAADFDVVVVGAGPAGSTAAIRLSELGYKVLVVDRTSFPRVKPCGGGLTIKALQWLPHSVAPVIEAATKKLVMGVKTPFDEKTELFQSDDYICTFVVREQFDKFNFERMIDAFVDFEENSGLRNISERSDSVELDFGSKRITAKYLIGADGANSVVRKILGVVKNFSRGFAIEGLVPYAKLDRIPDAEFFFGYVPNGYGWIFPKGDHLNVGIYTWDDGVSLSKDLLRTYCRSRLGIDELDHIVGFPLGFGGRRFVPTSNRVLMVGDAAGFAEPLLGEGLHNAIKSGRLAADAIHSAQTNVGLSGRAAYRKAIDPIVADLVRCDDMKKFYYNNMDGIGYGALKFPLSRHALMKGFAAGKTMLEITNQFMLSPFFSPAKPKSLQEYLSLHQHPGAAA